MKRRADIQLNDSLRHTFQQLDRAIREIQEELKAKRYDLPPIPPYPDKTKSS